MTAGPAFVRAFGAWAKERAQLPFFSSELPVRAQAFVIAPLGALAVVLCGLIIAAGGGVQEPGWVLFLGVLAAIGAHLYVESANGHTEISCGHAFIFLAFVVLSPGDAACMIAVMQLLKMPLGPSSWMGYVNIAGWGLVFLGALGAATFTGDLLAATSLHPVLQAMLAVLVASVVLDRLEIGYMALLISWEAPGRTLTERLASTYRSQTSGVLLSSELWVQNASTLVMVALGYAAWAQAPWLAVCMAAPELVQLRSLRQAAKLERALHSARTDPLTGLANRIALMEQGAAELELAERYGHHLSVILGDLDFFKRVNDVHGHLAGDEVLRRTAGVLQRITAREKCSVSRYGGEEFAVLVPVLDRDEVLALAECIRAAVEQELQEWDSSISLGVAYHQQGDTLTTMVERADMAMYGAKRTGKNRVCDDAGDELGGSGPELKLAA